MKYVFYYLSTLMCDMNYYVLEINLKIFENVFGKKYVIIFINIIICKVGKLLNVCMFKLLLGF